MEYNVAVVGEVDAAKSTLIGVLTSDILDDGRGKARLEVLSLKHEIETGRTSNVNTVLKTFKVNDKSVDVRFLDLAGHEKYINTTLKGLTAYYPDCALLLVAANRGVTRMTVEHFAACYKLSIPIIICITKIDIAPPEILKETIANVKKLCKPKDKKMMAFDIKETKDLPRIAEVFNGNPHSIIPFFKVSNVTGQGIDVLKEFFTLLDPEIKDLSVQSYMKDSNVKRLFIVYKPYYVDHIGYVVFGRNYGEPISKRDTLMIGPINSKYQEFTVKSIHNSKRDPVNTLNTGESGCLAMGFKKFQPNKKLLKGVVVIDQPVYVRRFVAEVIIGKHSTTIKPGYKPFINSGSVAIIAKIVGLYKTNPYLEDDSTKECTRDPNAKELTEMRIGDHGFIEFILFSSQFMIPNNAIIFRDGHVKGTGVISRVFPK